MKLIILLFLIFAQCYLCATNFRVIGELTKYMERSFSPSTENYLDNAYYIKTSSFSRDETLYFKVTIRYGYFVNDYMFYEGRNYIDSFVYLNNRRSSSYRDDTRIYSGLFYNSYTYGYKITNPSTNYLYVAPPDYRYQSGLSSITVASTNSLGIPVWVWIIVAGFVLVVAILSIVIYRCKRAQRENNIDTSSAEPIINTSPVPPSPSPYVPNPSPYAPNPTAGAYPLQVQPQVYY